MSPTDAAKLLELPTDATPEQLEARFLELRRKLEDKIAKAPTPGLQAKYRESLAEITTAFETLTLAADSSSLPVAQKSQASSPAAGGGVPSPRAGSDSGLRSQVSGLPTRRKSGGKEFALVAIIAAVVLAGGGWFVIKTRAENAEKARIAAEQKAEADRQVEETRLAAEAKKKAEEEEKIRVAAAAKAEAERLDKLGAQVRITLAEAKLKWEQVEKQERDAERDLSELKNQERSLRDGNEGRRRELVARIAVHSKYVQWLSAFLSTHPVKNAQVRATEFISSRLIDEAVTASAGLHDLIGKAQQEIDARKPKEDDLYGSVVIVTEPAGVPWKLSDAFGNTVSGNTPGTADRVAAGPATVFLQRPDWEESQLTVSVTAGKATRAEFAYRPASLQFTSGPSGAEVLLDGKPAGRTPLTLANLPHRSYSIEIRLSNYKSWTGNVKLAPGEKRNLEVFLNSLTDKEFIAQCSTRWSGTWSGTLRGILFYCKFVADSTRYVQWNGSGKYANNPPSQIDLVLVSRAPLVLDQILKFPEGRVGLDGSTG